MTNPTKDDVRAFEEWHQHQFGVPAAGFDGSYMNSTRNMLLAWQARQPEINTLIAKLEAAENTIALFGAGIENKDAELTRLRAVEKVLRGVLEAARLVEEMRDMTEPHEYEALSVALTQADAIAMKEKEDE